MAPTCYMEQLIYDCRMMNAAIRDGSEGIATYQRWAVDSDARFDPQAYILTPTNVIRIANAVVAAGNHYRAGCAAALTAIEVLRDGIEGGHLRRQAVVLDADQLLGDESRVQWKLRDVVHRLTHRSPTVAGR